MDGSLKYRLQPLRIPSSWSIEITKLFELELTPDTLEWFDASVRFVLQPQAVRP